MIRKILIFFLFLIPNAFANPNAYFTIQTVPTSSIPLPAPVVAVNVARPSALWSLLQNYDFSSPSYSNKSTWLGTIGSNSGFQFYHEGNCNLPGQETAESNFSMVTDGTIGKQVLQMKWDGPTDYNGQSSCDTQKETYMSTESTDKSNVTDFPLSHYTEYLLRLDVANPVRGSGSDMIGCAEYTSTRTRNGGGNNIGIERDICNALIETPSNTPYFIQQSILWYDSGHEFDGPSQQTGPPENLSIYHKIGVLTTSDGSTDIQTCYFLDDVRTICGSDFKSGSFSPFNVFNSRQFITMQLADTPGVVNELIQYIRVYACTGGLSLAEQCNGVIVTP